MVVATFASAKRMFLSALSKYLFFPVAIENSAGIVGCRLLLVKVCWGQLWRPVKLSERNQVHFVKLCLSSSAESGCLDSLLFDLIHKSGEDLVSANEHLRGT